MSDEFSVADFAPAQEDEFDLEDFKPSKPLVTLEQMAANRLAAQTMPKRQLPPSTPQPKDTTDYASESLIGISPEDIPSGAGTTRPGITIPLSAVAKAAAGLTQFATSPKGLAQIGLAATPAAPAIYAKWAYDMLKSGVESAKNVGESVANLIRDRINRQMASQMGEQKPPVDEEEVQRLADESVNAALSMFGGVGAAVHGMGKLPGIAPKAAPTVTETTPRSEPAPAPTAANARPAIRLVGGEVVTGEGGQTHPDIISDKGLTAEQIDQRGFVDDQGNFLDREQAAQQTGLPTEKEPERLHSTDLPEAKTEVPPATMTGAAHVSEFPEVSATGLKNAVGEMERVGLGLHDAPETVTRNMAGAWEQAGQIEREKPGTGSNLAVMLSRDPDMGLTDTESALLLRHKVDLWNRINDAAERTHKGDALSRKKAQAEHASLVAEFGNLLDAVRLRGREWGREGRWRQAMSQEDFTFSSVDELNAYRRQATGKDLTEVEKPKAEKIAEKNKQAQDALGDASQKLNDHIRQKKVPNAEQAALDAASKAVREADIRMANAENRARVADQKLKNATEQIQKDADQAALDAASKTVREAAVLKARAENKARWAEATREKRFAEKDRQVAAQAKAIADKRVRDEAVRVAREEQRRRADPSIAVWELANKYLEENKGFYGFDDLRNKIATDLKMTPAQVTRWMARDARAKQLADDLWTKQRNARRLKEQAKVWVKGLDTPGYIKALASIPRAMFSLAVFGHGFVALGTHAPIVAFQPRFWGAYVRNFGRMYRMVFSPAYYEAQMQDLVRRPNYEKFRRAGLQNDPFQYEEFHTTMVKDLVKSWLGEKNMERVDNFASAGNRGYAVLKVLRQDMADQKYSKLPDSVRKQDGVLEGMSDDINHATGVTKKQAPKGSNILLFAPRLAGSRVMWIGGDPIRAAKAVANWKNAGEGERQFAIQQMKEKAWVFGTFASILAINQGFLSASGSKQKINGIPESLGGAGFDPLAGDFMKFKAAGGDIAYGGALLTLAKLPVRIATAILYEGKGSKYILEDERVDKVIGAYIRSQMSPFAGTVTDLALGRDYQERPLPAKLFGTVEQTGAVPKRLKAQGVDEPYNWAEFTATKLPIPVAEGIKEGLRGTGMPEEQVNYWLRAMAITSLMTATGTRITEDTREEQ